MVDWLARESKFKNFERCSMMKNVVYDIFKTAVESVLPNNLIKNNLKLEKDTLLCMGTKFALDEFENIYVIGGGKASGIMALALESIIGDRIKTGIVAVKDHTGKKSSHIQIINAAHPIPDENSLKAARKVKEFAEEAKEKDLVIALISGGASSLLSSPKYPLTLKEKQDTTNALLKSGANIHEINTIRKHLSSIKGGQLAKIVVPAKLISLIISDVVGDDLGFISSGPTVPDRTSFNDCLKIIHKYNLKDKLPSKVIDYILKGVSGINPETPKPGDAIFSNVHNFLIGSNKIATKEAYDKAQTLGYNPIILTTHAQGEAREIAKFLIAVSKDVKKFDQPIQKPACIISAGESTVTIKGNGMGGRNQEMALAAAIELDGIDGITFLSAGTDGIDGFTDAAGAVVDSKTVSRGNLLNQSANHFLANNDSYNYFSPLKNLIKTGQTFTNVMDIQIILVKD
jgi:glycerate 2-kinase